MVKKILELNVKTILKNYSDNLKNVYDNLLYH
jgi:hypothetical protein